MEMPRKCSHVEGQTTASAAVALKVEADEVTFEPVSALGIRTKLDENHWHA